MLSFLSWYVISLFSGIVTFPIVFRFLRFLPDRGYSSSRTMGLLIWGYIYWILNILGILENNLGGVVFSFLVVLVVGLLICRKTYGVELKSWISSQKKLILAVEILFLVMFAFWAIVRAANPDVAYTEKPMELAFINSILRSPSFPPADPWLSGYSISYYYFGYIMVALFARLAGTTGGVTFNLAISMWFALAGIGAYGLIYNLFSVWQKHRRKYLNGEPPGGRAIAWAFLGPFYLTIVSNLEGFLEILHRRGLFWARNSDGTWQSSFWKWLDINDLNQNPALPFSWIPERATRGWTWWRASRVLQDYTISNMPVEIIDEFPFFSFLLSDLHPHVLAIPFGLLAILLSLNLFLGRNQSMGFTRIFDLIKKPFFWLAAIAFGGMAFLNIWDFPIFVGVFVLAYVYTLVRDQGWKTQWIWEFLKLGISVGLAGFVLYLPFFLSFASQAGGLIPSGVYVTRGVHFWIMFGSLLVPICIYLVQLLRHDWSVNILQIGGKIAFWIMLGLSLLSGFVALIAVNLTRFESWFLEKPWGSTVLIQGLLNWAKRFTFGDQNGIAIIAEAIVRRLQYPGTWVTLLIMMVFVWGLLVEFSRKSFSNSTTDTTSPDAPSPHPFVLILVLAGIGLTLFPEFFYLIDQFGNRMNTIFKFYYQAWILWGIAAAYSSVLIWNFFRTRLSVFVRILWSIVFLMGLAYPIFMLPERTNSFNPDTWTLDGDVYVEKYLPDDAPALRWLMDVDYGVIAEAVGPAYSSSGHGRVSVHTGLPTVLGWDNHERQWRGGSIEIGNRAFDIQTLYEVRDWEVARDILRQYSIKYVYVGSLERSSYRVSEQKFIDHLTLIYQNPGVSIYQVPDYSVFPETANP